MDFHMYDALGNDYLILDPNELDIQINPEVIRLLCDRHHGIGSDGILLGPIVSGSKLGLRIFNPDGSECEKSGNGLRIFARYLIDANYVTSREFSIHLLNIAKDIDISSLCDSNNQLKVGMGSYSFDSIDISLNTPSKKFFDQIISFDNKDVRVFCVNIGNPHCVVLGEEVTPEIAQTLGPKICEHSIFSNRTNVQFVNVLSRDNIEIEIWERGAGYTFASGSSSCAAVAVCHELGLVDRQVIVSMRGGRVKVDLHLNNTISLTGAVEAVFSGVFSNDLRNKINNLVN